jgi:hypothetical protein
LSGVQGDNEVALNVDYTTSAKPDIKEGPPSGFKSLPEIDTTINALRKVMVLAVQVATMV